MEGGRGPGLLVKPGCLGIRAWTLVFFLPFLSFGLGFGLGAAGLGHSDGLLALDIVSRLLQGQRPFSFSRNRPVILHLV